MTDFKTASKQACVFVRAHDACDLRCRDGRGKCSVAIAHMVGLTGMRVDEIRRKMECK